MDDEEAAYEGRQKINDLETGYIKPAGGGLWHSGEPREKTPRDAERSAIEIFEIYIYLHHIQLRECGRIRLVPGTQ